MMRQTKRGNQVLEKKGNEPDEKTEIKTVIQDEGEEVDRAQLPPLTPDMFTEYVNNQKFKFDPNRFRNREEFELFCMLPVDDAERQKVFDTMILSKDQATKKRTVG